MKRKDLVLGRCYHRKKCGNLHYELIDLAVCHAIVRLGEDVLAVDYEDLHGPLLKEQVQLEVAQAKLQGTKADLEGRQNSVTWHRSKLSETIKSVHRAEGDIELLEMLIAELEADVVSAKRGD